MTESVPSLHDPRFAPYVRADLYSRKLSFANKLRFALLACTVLPIKLVLCVLCLISFYLCCRVSLLLPTSKQLDVVAALGKLHSRVVLATLGFVHIKWKKADFKAQVSADHPPACIVSNHLGWVDIVLHAAAFFPSFVARQGTEDMPLVGVISKCLRCIYVEREHKSAATQGTAALIKKRIDQCAVSSPSDYRPLLLFPEGTTTNGNFLLPFKTGAFVAGKAVQPVLISYGKGRISPCWESISALDHLLLMMAEPFHTAEYYQLPPYIPSAEEAANPQLYADNLRQHMLQHSRLQPSSSTLEDKREYHTLLKAERAAEKAKQS